MNKFIKNIFYTVFSIVFILLFLNNNTYASNNKNDVNYYEIESEWWVHQNNDLKILYDIFLNKIINKEDFIADDAYYLRFREENDKLIIGSSAVVWCGMTMGDELDKYGYDVIGFGGIPDNLMKPWINIVNKKYKKIIYFSCVNTLDVCAFYNMDTINGTVFEAVVTTMMQAIGKLLEDEGLIYFVKTKYLQYDEQVTKKDRLDFCRRFNKMAKELNDTMDLVTIEKIDIKYPMDSEYSAGYVHYNNKVVWEDLLNQ